jgi:hypothetical protein
MSISMQDTIQPVSRHARPLREALEPGEEGLLTRIVIDRAKCGDAAALRFVLGQLYPRPRGRAIVLDLPAEVRSGNVVAVFDATLEAMTEGRITPEEARSVTLVLDGRLRVLETWERELNLERNERFASGGLIYPEKPVFRWHPNDDKENERPEPPGFAAAWAKHEAGWAEYEAKRAEVQAKAIPAGSRPAGASPQAGEGKSPANHLHPQAAVPPADGAATGKGEAGDTGDHLHSACISQENRRRDPSGAALKRKFVRGDEPAARWCVGRRLPLPSGRGSR